MWYSPGGHFTKSLVGGPAKWDRQGDFFLRNRGCKVSSWAIKWRHSQIRKCQKRGVNCGKFPTTFKYGSVPPYGIVHNYKVFVAGDSWVIWGVEPWYGGIIMVALVGSQSGLGHN